MRFWAPLCFFLLTISGLSAQERPGEPLAIEKQVTALNKSSQALQKDLSKLKKKLRQLLNKEANETGTMVPDSVSNEPGPSDSVYVRRQALADSLKSKIPDSQRARLDSLHADLLNKLEQTPPNLEIAQDLQLSVKEVEEVKQLLAHVQEPSLDVAGLQSGLGRDVLPKGRFERMMKRAKALQADWDGFAKGFEDWDEQLLARVSSLEEVAMLQEQKERMDNYKFLPEGYRDNMRGMQTNDFVKEKLQAKAEELENIGAKSMQEKLGEAQAKMAEAKEKFPGAESLENLPKRPPNPYKGDPFLKRLKFGFNFQVNRQEPASIDLALSVAYLLNERARLGLGSAYRIGLEKEFRGVNVDDQVFGLRSFFDYTVFRSIYVKALYEWNRTSVPTINDATLNRQWVRSGMLGLGNRFSIKHNLKGNFTALYNFLHDEKSPNPNPWVFRFGLEF